MNPLPAKPLLALAATALVLFAGCDDDDSDSGEGGDAQPAAELVAQADEICETNNEERPEAPTIPQNPSAAELRETTDYFEADLEITQQTLDELSELAPPEGLEEQWTTVLDGFQTVIDNYPDLIAAAEAGDQKEFVRVIGTIQEETQQLVPASSEIGLRVCASG